MPSRIHPRRGLAPGNAMAGVRLAFSVIPNLRIGGAEGIEPLTFALRTRSMTLPAAANQRHL
jgi:hypothetical protein